MPGGVCAVLDYETDMMAEYVADMATRIVTPHSNVTPAFRKFVNQILTSTRLPSTTILLGMNYLAKHINMQKQLGTYVPAGDAELWKMLTVGLLLGSKFLDDNTFQNRSWSDVSGIAVAELNVMECKWLRDMNWTLYVNLDRSHDYAAWLKSWKQYQDNKQHATQKQSQATTLREKLAPIITSINNDSTRQTHHPLSYEGWTQEEIADHDRHNSRAARPGKMSYRSREGSWSSAHYANAWTQAPPTPPDSGYGTPEHLNSAASVNNCYNDWFSQGVVNQNYGRYAHAPAAHHNFSARNGAHFHHQMYFDAFGHSSWNTGVTECNCQQCMSVLHAKPGPYFRAHPYGQTVMG